jgi:hypothetical protein
MGLIPTNKRANYLGIELEFISKVPLEKAREILYIMKLERFCDITLDASIETQEMGESHGLELRILSKQNQLEERLLLVQEYLNQVAYYTDDSCGIHVHIDMRNRNYKRSRDRLMSSQSQFRSMMPSHRVDPGSYNDALSHYEIKDIESGRYVDRSKDINIHAYNKYKTIEVRVHEATLDMNDLYDWCRYLTSVVDNKELDDGYINRRIKKYSNVHQVTRSSGGDDSYEEVWWDEA